MARGKSAKPIHARLCDLQSGQFADFYALLSEKTKGTTRDGKPFFSTKFRDAVRTVSFMVWADSSFYADCEHEWHVGRFYKLRATYVEHEKYGPQIELDVIREVNDSDREAGFKESDFRVRSRFDSEVMFAELRELVTKEILAEPVRKLVLRLLQQHADALKELPASPRHYYPFPGGWLEHTLSITKSCLWLTAHYTQAYPQLQPPLNRDLIVAGSVLHDIGRLTELTLTEGFEPTVPGRLFGHIFLGHDLVRDAAREQGDLEPEFFSLLEHLMMTYLALPEWGSPRLPAIPEVLIVHHAVDLDAKLEMYVRCLTRDTSAGPFTERDPILGRQLLRDRKI